MDKVVEELFAEAVEAAGLLPRVGELSRGELVRGLLLCRWWRCSHGALLRQGEGKRSGEDERARRPR